MDLKALGSGKTTYAYSGALFGLLEKFENPKSGEISIGVKITVPEFTSLCPITGQSDFATIVINYTPDEWCVESKSLKMYLGSFRQEGMFHEACVNRICNDLVQLLNPHDINVEGQFSPRGGISFWPLATWEK